MKNLVAIPSIIIFCLFVSSCKQGCTDCNALNFDPDANKNDHSCEYANEDLIGIYSVEDTTVDWSQTVWYDYYDIELKYGGCNPEGLIIGNYANAINQSTTNPLEIAINIEGDSIRIPHQFIEGDHIVGNSFGDFEIFETEGYFVGDSIYFPINYSGTNGDPYYGFCRGKKQ